MSAQGIFRKLKKNENKKQLINVNLHYKNKQYNMVLFK